MKQLVGTWIIYYANAKKYILTRGTHISNFQLWTGNRFLSQSCFHVRFWSNSKELNHNISVVKIKVYRIKWNVIKCVLYVVFPEKKLKISLSFLLQKEGLIYLNQENKERRRKPLQKCVREGNTEGGVERGAQTSSWMIIPLSLWSPTAECKLRTKTLRANHLMGRHLG